jgi:hypothetical protein
MDAFLETPPPVLAQAHAVQAEPADLQTDHIDAADDRGPRTWSLGALPLTTQLGWVGVEAALALEATVALTLAGGWLAFDPDRAYDVAVGVAFFPARFAFHGVYVRPSLAAGRARAGAVLRDTVIGAAVVGYQWTAPVGASLRLGGGIGYGTSISAGPSVSPPVPTSGILPQLDACLAWVF